MKSSAQINRDVIDRIAALENLVIHYPSFTEALHAIEECKMLSAATGTPRAMLVTGESGVGKSTLLHTILSRYPRIKTRERTEIPILAVEVPSRPTVKSMAEAVLGQFGSLYTSGTESVKTERVKLLVQQCGVQMLIFDEFQHIVDRNQARLNSAVADWLKNLMNAVGISVVAFGLPQAANLLQYNEQLRRRFSSTISLRPWGLESGTEIAEFRAVVDAMQRTLGMPTEIDLTGKEMIQQLYFASDGKIGYLIKLISGAGYLASKGATLRILRAHFREAFLAYIWASAAPRNNPFDDQFQPRRLTALGEPFAPPLV